MVTLYNITPCFLALLCFALYQLTFYYICIAHCMALFLELSLLGKGFVIFTIESSASKIERGKL